MNRKKVKRIAVGLSALLLSLSFAGCAPAEPPEWNGECYSGNNAPTKYYTANEGDLYVEKRDGDIHAYKNGEWTEIANVKDLPMVYNQNVDMYCGFDGYLWINGEQTTVVLQDFAQLNVMENTIELYDSTKYEGKDVSIPAREQITLMGTYGQYANNTQYSGTTVTQVKVISKTAGKLDLGSINLTTRLYTRWNTVDVVEGLNTINCNIEIDEKSTLVIGGSETTVRLYKRVGFGTSGEYGLFTTNVDKDLYPQLTLDQTEGIADTLIVQTRVQCGESSLQDHLKAVATKNEQAIFGGRKVSILGDSISSFNGWSNNTSHNSTMGSQGAHYSEGWRSFTVNDTWWKQLVDSAAMSLVVNNSWAGDTMQGGGQSRCLQLHNNSGVNPDVICMFFGINDVWRIDNRLAVPLTEQGFKNAFDSVIAKMQDKYKGVPIFVATYLPYEWWTSETGPSVMYKKTAQELEVFNNYIRQKVKANSGLYLVDLYKDSGITFDNYKNYYVDETNRWLHPNKEGMDKITQCFYNVMIQTFLDMMN